MDKPSEKRTSFVDVRRKSLTLSSIFNNERDQSNMEKSKLSMKSYLELLAEEKEDWKKILHKKKKMCDENINCTPLLISIENIEKHISTDDKSFLENKPDYLEMVNSVQRYINAVMYLQKYKSDIIDYYDKACNDIEVINKNLIDKMCAEQLCDICNNIDCNDEGHKFSI